MITNKDMFRIAKNAVLRYLRANQGDSDIPATADDIFIVWFCKTLQNFKVILGINAPWCRLFEVTFDGDRQAVYLDVYAKTINMTFYPKDLQ